jgi:hypothetical protein
MKQKNEDIDTKIFDKYRRVLVFSDSEIEFPESDNIVYFTLFDVHHILEDYNKLSLIFDNQKLPYLFIFNFPYNDKNFNANYIQII